MKRQILAALLVLILTPCLYADKNNRHGGRGKSSTGGLNISTTSLPAGTVAVAYSQTLAATGGTAPYTWTITGCSGATGCLPPPLVIGLNTGTIGGGNPTAAGVYSFIVTVTDAAAHSYPSAFAISIIAAAPPVLFSDNFESGNFSAWSASGGWPSNNPYIAHAPEPVHSGTYSYGQHYIVCSDSTNPACGASHQDANRYLVKNLSDLGYPTGASHLFMRAYLYLKTPTVNTGIIQRKLIRFWYAGAAPGTEADFLLDAWNATGGAFVSNKVYLSLSYGGLPAGGNTVVYDITTLNYDTWYSVEQEFILNTTGVADGTYRLWIGGVLKYQNTAIAIRGIGTGNVNQIWMGAQSDRNNYGLIDEYRYGDDIKISTSYIGP